MADLLGLPYLTIAAAAIIPAVMYYVGVFIAIDCAARRYKYSGLDEKDMVPLKEALSPKKSVPVFVPILLLIVFFLQGYTATTCASYALVATFILYLAVEPKAFVSRIKNLIKGLIDSAKSMLTTLSLIACAQILVCLISLTGIGVKFSSLIMQVGENSMFLAGLMAMVATMILGMGIAHCGSLCFSRLCNCSGISSSWGQSYFQPFLRFLLCNLCWLDTACLWDRFYRLCNGGVQLAKDSMEGNSNQYRRFRCALYVPVFTGASACRFDSRNYPLHSYVPCGNVRACRRWDGVYD